VIVTGYHVVAEARTWIGTRWKHQARQKGRACDCAGLILGVAIALDIPGAEDAAYEWTSRGYGREPDYDLALASCRSYMTELPYAQAMIGDVLFMRVPRGVRPQHYAIKSREDPPYMIHAWAESRGVVENRIDEAWRSRIAHAFRFPGIV
jgi:NlpC/P60 family putative phage cell wall peptidase